MTIAEGGEVVRPYYEIGPLTVGTYGVCFAVAAFTGLWLARVELRRRGHDPDTASALLVVVLLGALVGSRGAELIDAHGFAALLEPGAWFATEGTTFLGGFLGALLGVILYLRRRQIDVLDCLDAVAPAIVLGYALGRVGCQLSGDGCYGVATSLPWGMSYPHGAIPTTERVHPTPLYETLAAVLIFVALWRRRTVPARPGSLFARYLLLAGAERFAVEFLRRNPLHAGLTQAQWIGLGMVVGGTSLIVRKGRRSTSDPPRSPPASPGTPAVPRRRRGCSSAPGGSSARLARDRR